jgi:Flp pilus assembly protein TadG
MTHRFINARGQSVVEFALVMPLVLTVALGVIEIGYALLDQHVVAKLTREGSNLISRDSSLQDAETVMQSMQTRPVDFNSANSRLIFSVLRKGATTSTANYDKVILYQRHAIGGLTGASVQSKLLTRGTGSFRGAPNYEANNSDTDANLQISPLPPNVDVTRGGLLYVTEVYTRHPLITPLNRFGVTVPDILYSIAVF